MNDTEEKPNGKPGVIRGWAVNLETLCMFPLAEMFPEGNHMRVRRMMLNGRGGPQTYLPAAQCFRGRAAAGQAIEEILRQAVRVER